MDKEKDNNKENEEKLLKEEDNSEEIKDEEDEIINKLDDIKQDEEKETKESDTKNLGKKEVIEEEKNKSKNNKENKTAKNNKKLVFIICGIIILFLIIFSTIFSLTNINNNNILSGVSIEGINFSNMSQEEATQKLNKLITEKFLNEIKLVKGKYEVEINANDIDVKIDTEKAIESAYEIGRSGNIITNNYSIFATKLFKKDISLEISYNEEALNKIIQDTSLKLPTTVIQSSYYIDGENLIITKGNAGDKIKEDELKRDIYNNISNINISENKIEIPVEHVEPDKINLEKIKEEIYKEPQDAYVTKNPTEVHPNVNGVDFNITMEEAKKIIQEDKKEYIIPLKITIANKTVADLGEEAFPDRLSTFTTRYDASNRNRSTNISLATKEINGMVIMPGEVFSYNQTLGRRTLEKGYKEGTAYVGGKVVPDVGGGICQVSSTLYNTALLANLEIVERSNHLFECSYVSPSRDATVYWGSIDFKFKNTREYPIKIVGYAKNGVVKIDMYGIKEKEEYEVIIDSEVTSYIANKIEYVNDSTIEKGKQVITQTGFNGCKSVGYRILKKNGITISKTLLSKDTYSPQNRIIKVGTKVTTTKTSTGDTSTNNTENTDNSEQLV